MIAIVILIVGFMIGGVFGLLIAALLIAFLS